VKRGTKISEKWAVSDVLAQGLATSLALAAPNQRSQQGSHEADLQGFACQKQFVIEAQPTSMQGRRSPLCVQRGSSRQPVPAPGGKAVSKHLCVSGTMREPFPTGLPRQAKPAELSAGQIKATDALTAGGFSKPYSKRSEGRMVWSPRTMRRR